MGGQAPVRPLSPPLATPCPFCRFGSGRVKLDMVLLQRAELAQECMYQHLLEEQIVEAIAEA